MRLRSLARASLSAATASARCVSRSRDSRTAITSPAWTTLFFSRAIFLICALIFAATSAFSRGQIVPTAETGAAMFSFSALTTFTLTTGVTSVSASVADRFKRQMTRPTSNSTTSPLPTIKTRFRWRTMRARFCSASRRSTSSSGILFGSSLIFSPSLTGCLSQSRKCSLVIEDRLIQSTPLLDQGCLSISHFNDLRLAGTVTSDRRSEIVLCFRHTFTREIDSHCGVIHLRARRVELLCEATQREGSFVFSNIHAQFCLAFAAATRAPIKDRNRKTDCGRDAAVLLQTWALHRVGNKTAIDRIRERRQAIGASNPDLFFCSA